MRKLLLVALLSGTTPAVAQQAPPPSHDTPSISVSGEGRIKTRPDIADISYSVTTEGSTPDAATSSLADKVKAIGDALAGLSPEGASSETGSVSLKAARSPDCKQGGDDDDTPRLSTGPCAYKGYVASMSVHVRLAPQVAGTAVGLAARLGATEAEIESFSLRDQHPPRAQALAAAVADARAKAAAIAEAGGARLGPLMTANDLENNQAYNDIIVTAERRNVAGSPPPIQIAIDPKPVETVARVSATFAILR